jgi:hypothetical protein
MRRTVRPKNEIAQLEENSSRDRLTNGLCYEGDLLYRAPANLSNLCNVCFIVLNAVSLKVTNSAISLLECP